MIIDAENAIALAILKADGLAFWTAEKTMFHLKTEIERKLYIQALLQCLERGTLTAEELLNDFNTIILTIARAGIIEDRRLQRRIEGILAAYKCHAIDLDEASTGVLSIFDELKASPSIFDAAPYLTSASA